MSSGSYAGSHHPAIVVLGAEGHFEFSVGVFEDEALKEWFDTVVGVVGFSNGVGFVDLVYDVPGEVPGSVVVVFWHENVVGEFWAEAVGG